LVSEVTTISPNSPAGTGVIDAGYDGALYAAAALLLGTLGLVAASMSASITGGAIALLPRGSRFDPDAPAGADE
jgi:hypothetical protein